MLSSRPPSWMRSRTTHDADGRIVDPTPGDLRLAGIGADGGIPAGPILVQVIDGLLRDAPDAAVRLTPWLLAHGAAVDARDAEGTTALLAAANADATRREATDAIVAMLLAAGADPSARDQNGMTPLLHAARTRRAATTGMLIAAGSDPMAMDARGYGALGFVVGTHIGSSGDALLIIDAVLAAGGAIGRPPASGFVMSATDREMPPRERILHWAWSMQRDGIDAPCPPITPGDTAWAATQAAAMPDARWSMRLLAACGRETP